MVRPPLESLSITGKRNAQINFSLIQPDKEQICPITQEPIEISKLDFIDSPFDPNFPEYNAIKLPCQHTFTALCLVFHWARNDTILCPLCRAGPPGARLNLRKLPSHFRLPMGRRVRESKRRDRVEAIRENEIAARRIEIQAPIAYVVCIIHARSGIEHHVRMAGVCVQDQIVFTANGMDLRTLLLATNEAMLTITIQYGLRSIRFPSSSWFPVPRHAAISATQNLSPFQYVIAVTAHGASIRCNVPTFIFNLVAFPTGIMFS